MILVEKIFLKTFAQYNKFLINSSWLLLLKLLQQALGFAVAVFLVRTLSQNEYGQFNLVTSAVALCSIFSLSGINTVTIQSVARGYLGTFREGIKLSLKFSLLGAIALIGWGLYQKLLLDDDILFFSLTAAGLLFPMAYGLNNWQAFYTGSEQFRLITIHRGHLEVLANGGILVALWLGSRNILVPVLILYLVLAAQNVRMSYGILKTIPLDAPPEPNAIRYGLRTSFYGGFNLVANSVDRLLLFYFVSPEALAVYAASDRIPEAIKKNLQSLNSVLIPSLSRKEKYTREIDRRFNLFGLILVVGLGILGIFVIPWLLPLIYTETYADAVLYCQILLVSIAIGMFATLKYSYILSKIDEQSFRDYNIYMSLARIVFAIVLVPTLGILGAALSTVLYRVVTFTLVHYYLKKHHI